MKLMNEEELEQLKPVEEPTPTPEPETKPESDAEVQESESEPEKKPNVFPCCFDYPSVRRWRWLLCFQKLKGKKQRKNKKSLILMPIMSDERKITAMRNLMEYSSNEDDTEYLDEEDLNKPV